MRDTFKQIVTNLELSDGRLEEEKPKGYFVYLVYVSAFIRGIESDYVTLRHAHASWPMGLI